MGENLKTTHYKNGDEIPIVYSSTEWENLFSDAYGVYPLNEDGASQLTCGDNCADVYGNLYNWYSVNDNRGICPEGFHVPSDVEFMELEMFLGMSESEANDISWRGTNEGSKLAGNEFLWNDGGLDTESEFGTSGFNALPVGYRSSNGAYRDMALISFFWSSTETSSYYALQRAIDSNSSQIRRYSNDSKSYGFSIRCLKD